MSEHRSLMPSTSTPYEHALADNEASRRPLPYEQIALLNRANAIPAHMLPWLAYDWSVDLWDDAWPLDRQRQVVARSIALHRIKGTGAALREYLDLAGTPVVGEIVTAPQGFFAGADRSAAEQEAWLQGLPEVRLYVLRDPTPGSGCSDEHAPVVADMMLAGDDADAPAGFSAGPEIVELVTRRAVLIENGIETELVIDRSAQDDVGRFAIPHDPGPLATAGEAMEGCYAGPDEPDRPTLITIRRAGPLHDWSLRPGRTPVSATPRRVHLSGVDEDSVFADGGGFDGFVAPGVDPDTLTYESWRITMPGSLPGMAASFTDFDRLGWPAYTAAVAIDARAQAHDAWWFAGSPGLLVATTEDADPLARAIEAVRAGAALRDTILLDTDAFALPTVRTARTVDALELR